MKWFMRSLVGTVVSGGFFLLFLAGAWIGWRRGYAVALHLILIASWPATIAFVLINMRYTVTVQPVIMMFVAVTIAAALERMGLLSSRSAGVGRS